MFQKILFCVCVCDYNNVNMSLILVACRGLLHSTYLCNFKITEQNFISQVAPNEFIQSFPKLDHFS